MKNYPKYCPECEGWYECKLGSGNIYCFWWKGFWVRAKDDDAEMPLKVTEFDGPIQKENTLLLQEILSVIGPIRKELSEEQFEKICNLYEKISKTLANSELQLSAPMYWLKKQISCLDERVENLENLTQKLSALLPKPK